MPLGLRSRTATYTTQKMLQECPSNELIVAHLASELDDQDSADAVRNHVDECANCRSVVVALVRARGTPNGAGLGAVVVVALGSAPTLESDVTTTTRLVAAAPKRIGRYRIEHELGAGGMGVVYAAHDVALDRVIALKVLRPDIAAISPLLTERLVRESRMLARVSDAAVITVHDVGEQDGQVFVAMELIAGETLGAWLKHRQRDIKTIVDVFRRAGEGLAAAHRAGLVHRDFKPDNVLIAPVDGAPPTRVVVTDFGLARAIASVTDDLPVNARSPSLELTAPGTPVGTPAYMAPEQFAAGTIDHRADIFAFGVSLWEALYGQRPFAGNTPAQLAAAITSGTMREGRLDGRAPLPPPLRRLLRSTLALDPNDRPASMAEVLVQLDRWLRPRRRWPYIAAATAAVLAGAVVIKNTMSPASDRCAAPRDRLNAVAAASTLRDVRTAMARSAFTTSDIDKHIAALEQRIAAQRLMLNQTCAGPMHPMEDACLAARQVEIAAVAEQLQQPAAAEFRGKRFLPSTIIDPALCTSHEASLDEPMWPRDASVRNAVLAWRRRLAVVENQRDQGKFAEALASVNALEAEATSIGWPSLVAEHTLAVGSIQAMGGDSQKSTTTLRRAAMLAEQAHNNYIAGNAWAMLIVGAAMDEHAPDRGLEYADNASTASARIGKPAALETLIGYGRGMALIEKRDIAGGERVLRDALKLAEAEVPTMVAVITQGLAYMFENDGRYEDAVIWFQRALDVAAKHNDLGNANEVVFRGRLATNLSHVGKSDEALAHGAQAVALADRILDAKSADRVVAHSNFGEILRAAGKTSQAIAQITTAEELAKAANGERSELFGQLLSIEASMRQELGELKQAVATAKRACEILAFAQGDESATVATCWADAANIMIEAGEVRPGLARLDAIMPTLVASYGEDHAIVANAHISRGDALLQLHDYAGSAVAFERGRVGMAASTIEPGYLASAEWGLGQALVQRDYAKAHALVEQAAARWRNDSTGWTRQLADAEAWLRAHPARQK